LQPIDAFSGSKYSKNAFAAVAWCSALTEPHLRGPRFAVKGKGRKKKKEKRGREKKGRKGREGR